MKQSGIFKFSKIANEFDSHLSGQLYWHKQFLQNFLPEIASIFMAEGTNVYDFGASTGNVEMVLTEKIDERKINFSPVEKCAEMVEKYKGNKDRVIENDFLNIELKPFSFATSILSLCFVHPSKRGAFISELKNKCLVGGAILILEKMKQQNGYLGSAFNRVTWRNKLDNGESIEMVINKELSLSGVQWPISHKELNGFEIAWAYGDFRSYIWVKDF